MSKSDYELVRAVAMPHLLECHESSCRTCAALARSLARARRCGCTYVVAELLEEPVCPRCGHRDHGRAGCAS